MKNLENGTQPNFNNQEEHEENIDLRTIDEGRYITPSEADNANAKLLEVGKIRIPVSLTIKDKRFRLNGVEAGTSNGLVVSGVYAPNAIKINHIFFSEDLRRTGLSRLALQNLESEMRDKGVKVAYASFVKQKTVEFFLQNGFEIVSFKTLSEEEKKALIINEKSTDLRINNKTDYENIKNQEPEKLKKILLRHYLANI